MIIIPIKPQPSATIICLSIRSSLSLDIITCEIGVTIGEGVEFMNSDVIRNDVVVGSDVVSVVAMLGSFCVMALITENFTKRIARYEVITVGLQAGSYKKMSDIMTQ